MKLKGLLLVTLLSSSVALVRGQSPTDVTVVQGANSGDITADLRRSFMEVANFVTKAAELVPADKYAFKPVQTVRTFGQVVAHIVDSHNYFCAYAAGKSVQWADPAEKGSTDKATLLPKLKQSIDACNAALNGGATKPRGLIDNIGHTNLHYGNMTTYIRILGLVPPSS